MMAWLRRLHAWAGLGLCLLLAAIALSGAALVFEPQLRAVSDPAMRVAAPPPSAPTLAAVMRRAQAEAGSGGLRSLVFASADTPLHEASFADGGGAWLAADGAAKDRWGENGRLLDVIFDLHHHLFAGETGTLVTGWIGCAALAMLFSGLILWWPARGGFSGSVLPRRATRAGWLAAHRDLAVMAAPLIAVSLLTGTPVALQKTSRAVMDAPAPKPPKARTSGPVNWDAALAAAQQRFPSAVIRIAQEPAKPSAPVAVRLKQPAEWHSNGRTIVYLEPATSAVIGVYDSEAQPTGGRLYNVLWPIHAAKVGGWFWKLAMLISGLSLAALSLYGGEAYRRRLFTKRL